MRILYDTQTYVVFEKLPGMESESISWEDVYDPAGPGAGCSGTNAPGVTNAQDRTAAPDRTSAPDGSAGRLYCVHRLDKEVGGVTVCAKDEKTAAILSKGFQDRTVTKTYLALAEGCPEPAAGEMEDLLFHDRRTNKTFVVSRERKGVKKASLSYEVLKKDIILNSVQPPQPRDDASAPDTDAGKSIAAERAWNRPGGDEIRCSLVRIRLHTGRTHQIRIQFASRKFPLVGDRRYGAKTKLESGIGLWSHELRMRDPETGEEKLFTSAPPFPFPV